MSAVCGTVRWVSDVVDTFCAGVVVSVPEGLTAEEAEGLAIERLRDRGYGIDECAVRVVRCQRVPEVGWRVDLEWELCWLRDSREEVL